MSGAPMYPGAPPITSTAPAVYLEPPTAFGQAAASVSAPVRSVAAVALVGLRAGCRCRPPRRRHAALRPGSTAVPSLRPWKQTVTSARDRGAHDRARSTRRPPTARRAPRPSRPAAASPRWPGRTAPRGAPRKPVPRSASTTTSARSFSRARRDAVHDRDPEPPGDVVVQARVGRQLPDVAGEQALDRPSRRRAGGGRRRTRRRRCCPRRRRWRRVRRLRRRMISSAAARPARSMSTAPGMPSPSMARASTARISSAV